MYVSNLANDRLPYIIFNSANVADERPLQCIISFSPDSIPPTDVQRYIKGTMRIIYTSNIIKTIISREGDVVDDIFFTHVLLQYTIIIILSLVIRVVFIYIL